MSTRPDADKRRRGAESPVDILSLREREVLAGLARGMTNKEMGLVLGISHRTVEVHRAKLMRKLEARSLAAVLDIAFTQRERLPVILND